MQERLTNTLKKSSTRLTDVVKLNRVQRSLQTKVILFTIISLLISSPIAAYLNSLLEPIIGASVGIYLNTIISLVVTTGIIIFFIKMTVLQPLQKAIRTMEKVADGDLKATIEHQSKDEIGQLASAFNLMVGNLRALIDRVNDTSEHVAASSQHLLVSMEGTSTATNEVTSALQEVAKGAELTVQGANLSKEVLQEMTTSISQVADTFASVSGTIQESASEAETGYQMMDQTTQQMGLIDTSAKASAKLIEQLSDRSKEIGQIVEVITEISNQTNMLALNAAIEAARAGEHGKGFSVVADEVRKLAEQTKASSNQIIHLIAETQEDTQKAMFSMNEVLNEVKNGLSHIQGSGESFKKIVDRVYSVSQQIQSVTEITDQVVAKTKIVMNSMENTTSIAYESSEQISKIAASSEEQLSSIEEIEKASAKLSEMAQSLQEGVTIFKT